MGKIIDTDNMAESHWLAEMETAIQRLLSHPSQPERGNQSQQGS